MKRQRDVSGISRDGRAQLKWRRSATTIKRDRKDKANLDKVIAAGTLVPVAMLGGRACSMVDGKPERVTKIFAIASVAAPPFDSSVAFVDALTKLGPHFIVLGRGDSLLSARSISGCVGAAEAPSSDAAWLRITSDDYENPLSHERLKGARLYVLGSRIDIKDRDIATLLRDALPKTWRATLPPTELARFT